MIWFVFSSLPFSVLPVMLGKSRTVWSERSKCTRTQTKTVKPRTVEEIGFILCFSRSTIPLLSVHPIVLLIHIGLCVPTVNYIGWQGHRSTVLYPPECINTCWLCFILFFPFYHQICPLTFMHQRDFAKTAVCLNWSVFVKLCLQSVGCL